MDPEVKTYSEDEYNKLVSDNTSMKSKMDELLSETKKAKSAKKEADNLIIAAQDDKAKKDGDFEQLFKSSEQKIASLQDENAGLKSDRSKGKINNIATTIASELADGPNAGIIKDYIAKRLGDTDDGVKVLDSSGNLTVSTVEDLKNEFKNDSRWNSLLRGNQSSGGGAPGGKSSSAASNEMKLSDFDKMTPKQRSDFSIKGGKLIDD